MTNIITSENGQTLLFKLNTLSVNTWNGDWTGRNSIFVVTKRLTKKIKEQLARHEINLDENQHYSFFYDFGDGWKVSVEMYRTYSKDNSKIVKQSSGFLNYGWMIDSIIKNGKIIYDD